MKPETMKPIEWIVPMALLFLLVIAPTGITVGLRNSLAALLALVGLYQVARGRCTFPHLLLLPLLAWVGVTLASALWSWDPMGTFRSAINDALLPIGVLLAAWHLTQRPFGSALWIGVLASAPIIAGAGLGVITLTGTAGLYEPALRQGWLATYPGVGVATTVAVLILPFCLAGFLQNERLIRRMSIISLCSILVIGLVSQNRAIWPALALTGGIQAMAIFRQHADAKKHWRRLVLGALCCVGILAAGWLFTLSSRLPTQPGQEETIATVTHDVRWAAWKIWAEKGTEHPLLGFGYGKRLIPMHIEPAYRERLAAIDAHLTGHAHNLLLNVWLQTGFLGLVVLLALFATITWHLLFSRKIVRSEFPASATIGISLIAGLLIKNMTDDFFGQALALHFWLLLGIALGLHEAKSNRHA